MRKFKVVRKWPGGPEVGTILSNYNVYANFYSAYGSVERSWHINELTAEYTEEIKEPDEFWYMPSTGEAISSTQGVSEFRNVEGVPNWLRFRTKDSAEKFAKALKDTHGFEPRFVNVVAICDALNDRVK